jgi:outer membrane protein OmpA-like peptidoglycan-associated protein
MQILVRSLLVSCCITAVSCVGMKKMTAAKEKLNGIKEAQAGEVKQIQQIDATTTTKLSENKIDSIINDRFGFRVGRIKTEMDSVSKEITSLDSLMADKKEFRRSYKKIIIPRLAMLDSFRLQNASRSQVYLMLEDGLNTSTYTLFDLAAFFGPGKYAIPEGQEEVAASSFSPLVDSVIKFSEKYKNFSQTATLVILGFADGTGFDPQSPLYAELAGLIGRPEVAKQELNQKLSELRAETLIKQLRNQFIKKLGGVEETNKIHIEYIGRGKGEQYPFRSIADYKEEDDRRRIVLCYWAVLPK